LDLKFIKNCINNIHKNLKIPKILILHNMLTVLNNNHNNNHSIKIKIQILKVINFINSQINNSLIRLMHKEIINKLKGISRNLIIIFNKINRYYHNNS